MKPFRRGIALYLVLMILLILSLLTFSMLRITGQLRGTSADLRQKLHARLAAEGAVSLAIANTRAVGNEVFALPLGYNFGEQTYVADGDTGRANAILATAGSTGTVNSGPMAGMNGFRYGIRINAVGQSGGGAIAPFSLDLDLFQVPIFQFGQFNEGDVTIMPGTDRRMTGLVHTNGSLFLYPGARLTLLGPVTASGTICWRDRGGSIAVYKTPTDPTDNWVKSGSTSCLDSRNGPPAVGTYQALRQGVPKLNLPVEGGANLNALLQLKRPTDAAGLKRQKFDWLVQNPDNASAQARWVFSTSSSTQPSWISGPHRFLFRPTWRWCRYWQIDVAAMQAATGDSLFYFADTSRLISQGSLRDTVVNAFVFINGDSLRRNLSIATPNLLLLVGNYNTANLCRDPSGANSRCNAMIAGGMIFHVSQAWLSPTIDGPLNRTVNYSAGTWNPSPRTLAEQNPGCHQRQNYGNCPNSAFTNIFGNTPGAPSGGLPRPITQNAAFLGQSQLVMEDFGGGSNIPLNLSGSFVIPSDTVYPGYRTNFSCESNQPIQPGQDPFLAPDVLPVVEWYRPPLRNFNFDAAFNNLRNMPPFTPYLSVLSQTQWREGP